MLRTLKIGLLGGVLFALSGSVSFAYDAAADFSVLNGNPNGVWSYGYKDITATPTFHLDSDHTSTFAGLDQWRGDVPAAAGNDGNPSVFKNTTASTNQATNLPAGELGFHPGAAGENAVVSFTAPSTGTYDVSAAFRNYGGGGTDVHIYAGSFANEIFNNGGNDIVGASTPATYSNTSLQLTGGELLYFTVGVGKDGTFNSDTTGLAASITAIPEPAYYQASALIGLGGIGLLRLRRRKTA